MGPPQSSFTFTCPSPPQPFNLIPPEVFLRICANADWRTLVRASQVSRLWRYHILADRTLWTELDDFDLTRSKELTRVGVWAERAKGGVTALEVGLGRDGNPISDEAEIDETVSNQSSSLPIL